MQIKSLIITISLFFSIGIVHSQTMQKPQDFSLKVFNILKNLDKQTTEEYINNFEKIDVIREDVRSDGRMSDEDKYDFLTISKDIWETKILSDRARIISKGVELKISWDSIVYSDFIYIEKPDKNFPLYECVVIFDSKNLENLIYGVEIVLFVANDNIYIYEIKKLKTKIKGESKN